MTARFGVLWVPFLLGVLTGIAWASDADIKFSTNDGTTKLSIWNSQGTEIGSINSLGNAQFQSQIALSAEGSFRVTATTTTNSNTLGSTGLVFLVNAGENWSFEYYLQVGCSGNGGIKWAISNPGGTTLYAEIVGSAATNTLNSDVLTVLGTISTNATSVSNANGWTRITGVIVGTAAGPVTLQFASGTPVQNSSVYPSSYVVARKLN